MSRLRYSVISLVVALIVLTPLRADDQFRYPEKKHDKAELRYINGVPVLTVEGTPAEIGEQVGTLQAPAGNALASYFNRLMRQFRMESALPFLKITAKGMLRQFPADHRTELDAAINSFGVDGDLILLGNCLWDIKKLGCSTLIVEPERSATRTPIFGRNFDFPSMGVLHKYTIVTVYRPTGKHAFASVGFPGFVGVLSAMNDAGLTLAVLDVIDTADGAAKFDLTGTPMCLTFRRIMEECTTVAEAEKLLRASKRTTLLNLAVCDKHGGKVFELTPKSVSVRDADNGICPCTNHFRTKPLATDLRCYRYDHLIECQKMPTLGFKDVVTRLHAANQGEFTMQTMVFEPAALKLHLAYGKGPSSALPLHELELAKLLKPE